MEGIGDIIWLDASAKWSGTCSTAVVTVTDYIDDENLSKKIKVNNGMQALKLLAAADDEEKVKTLRNYLIP